jgi:hypothetical protein
MGDRSELWRTLDAVADDLQAAFDAWERKDEPSTRESLSAAVIRWSETLGPLIGYQPAFAFESALRKVMDAMDRHERLLACVVTQDQQGVPIDNGDVAFLRQSTKEQEDAMREYLRLEVETGELVQEARRRDQDGGTR